MILSTDNDADIPLLKMWLAIGLQVQIWGSHERWVTLKHRGRDYWLNMRLAGHDVYRGNLFRLEPPA